MSAETAQRPKVKGWCPGAHHPMMSGDGLVVRVRPFHSQLDRQQVLGLCDLAEEFGNGMLDLTSRANFQIRGVAEQDHHPLLAGLDALGLIDTDPSVEGHRNILMPPDWAPGDLTHRLANALLETLPKLPDLPEKMGFAIDTAGASRLADGSADFRFELSDSGALLLRADGCAKGRLVAEADAMQALVEMAGWFDESGGRSHGRMARHVPHAQMPRDWSTTPPRPAADIAELGPADEGTFLGAPFGKIAAPDLRALMQLEGAAHLRLMLNRMLFLTNAHLNQAPGFVTAPSRLMQVHACPGAPFCPQASVATMELAQTLAKRTTGSLHVSGCAKGCAYPRRARTTLVGRDGKFDLVSDGCPWDDARLGGLDPSEINEIAKLI